ncbi:MAG: biotin/lipoate protein ligase [Betaproteobacteria bacterium]|nr:biotin/lipoate protein ligase [Betaproteobacteria bacterium]
MAETWRLLDTGLASPARNIALNRALLEARATDEIPSTLRFARFTRCVLIGARHSGAQELDLEYCRQHAIALQRRITSGSAGYVDERQLVWELYLHRRELASTSLHALGRRICHAAATGLSAFDVDARFRERAQIEIDGCALASGGFAVERDAILFQGMLTLEAQPAGTLGVLRTPWSGDAESIAAAATTRLTSLNLALGSAAAPRRVKQNLAEAFESEFDVEFRDADCGLSEHTRCEAAMAAIDTRDWIEHIATPASDAPLLAATYRTGAGALAVALTYDRAARTIRRVWITSPCPCTPARACADFEAALTDVPLTGLERAVGGFFGSRVVDCGGYTPADFIAALKLAVRQPLLADNS